jgi:hypothetical protein
MSIIKLPKNCNKFWPVYKHKKVNIVKNSKINEQIINKKYKNYKKKSNNSHKKTLNKNNNVNKLNLIIVKDN